MRTRQPVALSAPQRARESISNCCHISIGALRDDGVLARTRNSQGFARSKWGPAARETRACGKSSSPLLQALGEFSPKGCRESRGITWISNYLDTSVGTCHKPLSVAVARGRGGNRLRHGEGKSPLVRHARCESCHGKQPAANHGSIGGSAGRRREPHARARWCRLAVPCVGPVRSWHRLRHRRAADQAGPRPALHHIYRSDRVFSANLRNDGANNRRRWR